MKKMIKNVTKKIAAAVLAGALAFALFGCADAQKDGAGAGNTTSNTTTSNNGGSASTNPGEAVTIRVANFALSVWNDQFLVAYQLGFFDEAFADDNVNIEIIEFANGPAANEAFVAGDIDIVNGIGDQPIVIGIGNGVPTSVLAGAAKQGDNIGIIAKGDSGITSASDLKGKKIGVFIGTYVHKSLIGILNDAGISEDDVEIVNITSTSDADAAFESGDIDAYLSMSGYHIHKKEEQGFVLVANCANHQAFSYIVAADAFINSYPEITQKFIDTLYRAEQWINEHDGDEYYQVISDFSGREVEDVKYTNQDATRTLLWDDDYEQNLLVTYEFLNSHELIANELSNEDILSHVNTTFINNVAK